MAQVLLIEENKNLNELLSINLTTYVGAEVIPRKNAQDAIDLLRILPTIDLIICGEKVGAEETAREIALFLKDEGRETSLIVLGALPPEAASFGVQVENPKNWEAVIQLSTKILGVTPKMLEDKILPDYIPIPIYYFYPLDMSCCDVFIRIRKTADEFQFIKRIHSGDAYSKDMVRKYDEQGLKFFYIPREMQQYFTNFVSDQLVKKLDKVGLESNEQIEILKQSHSIALKEIHKLGFTSATIQLSESIVRGMVDSFKKNPEMSGLLHKIINSESSYMYQHCHMTSVVASECLKNLKMDNTENHQILAYASFFKDISLVDKPALARITTFDELEKAELSEEDWDLVFNHAFEASVMIQKNPEAPFGVDEVIRNHHGTLNGKGYSNNSQRLSTISKIFVISCEFVKELLAFKERGGKPTPIIDELYKRFESPEMALVIRALETTLKKSTKK